MNTTLDDIWNVELNGIEMFTDLNGWLWTYNDTREYAIAIWKPIGGHFYVFSMYRLTTDGVEKIASSTTDDYYYDRCDALQAARSFFNDRNVRDF